MSFDNNYEASYLSAVQTNIPTDTALVTSQFGLFMPTDHLALPAPRTSEMLSSFISIAAEKGYKSLVVIREPEGLEPTDNYGKMLEELGVPTETRSFTIPASNNTFYWTLYMSYQTPSSNTI